MEGKPRERSRNLLSPTVTSGIRRALSSSPVAQPTPPHPSTSPNVPVAMSSSPRASTQDIARNKQERALEVASAFRTLLSIAEKTLDGCPVWGPKAVVAAAGEVLRITQLRRENDDTINNVRREAQTVLAMISKREKNGISDTMLVISDELQSRMDRFRAEIEEHLRELNPYRAAKFPSQATGLSDSFKEWLAVSAEVLTADAISKALPEINRKISASIQNFILVSQINNEVVALTTMNRVVAIEEHLKANHEAQYKLAQQNTAIGARMISLNMNERDLLSQLHPIKTAFHNVEGAPRTCHTGTREAVLHQVEAWFRDPMSPSVLWLSGIAGTGKTTIAQSICELLEQDLGASFLFSRDFAERRRPSNILPTIAYQLAYSRPALRSPICELILKDVDFALKSVRVQAQELLGRTLGSDFTSDFPVTLLLFDALDECDKDDNQEGGDFVPLLLRFLRMFPFRFKVVITSRPETSIRRMLEIGSGQTDLFVLHEVDKNMVQADITTYLRYELGEMAGKRGLDEVWPAAMREEQVKQLAALADRLFIFAATVVKALSKSRLPAAMIQSFLDNVSQSDQSIHGPLDRMYFQIVKGVLPADVHDKEAQELTKTFQIVVGAIITLEQPLTFASLRRLLNVDENQLHAVIGPLYSVLYVDDALLRPIQVFHLSFPDFLTDNTRCSDVRFQILRTKSHSMISVCCLRIMNEQLKRNICGIGNTSLLNTEVEDLAERRERCTSSELRYACLYWWAHIENTESATEELIKELEMFTSGRLLLWLELLSLMGNLRSALIGLPKAIGWCRSIALSDSKQSYRMRVLRFVSTKYPKAVTLNKSNEKGQEAWSYQLLANVATLLYDANRTTQAFFRPISEAALQVYETPTVFMPHCPLLLQSDKLHPRQVKMLTPERRSQWSQDLQVMEGHKGRVRQVTVSPNGSLLASCSDDKTIRLWDFASGSPLISIDSDSRHLAFSMDNSQLFTLGKSFNTLQTWDVAGDVLNTVSLSSGGIRSEILYGTRCEAISPTGERVVAGIRNGSLCIFTVEGAATLLQGHTDSVTSIGFSRDGLHIVSGSEDGTVRVLNVGSLDWVAAFHGRMGYPISKVYIPPDGLHIVALGRNQIKSASRVWTWNITTLRQRFAVKIAGCPTVSSLSVNETTLVCSPDSSGTLYTYDVTSGQSLSIFRGHTRKVSSSAFTPDGLHIVSGSEDCTIRVWDAQINTTADSPLRGHNIEEIHDMVFSTKQKKLYLRSGYKTLRCWDTALGRLASEIKKDAFVIGLSARGLAVALHWEESIIDVWNAETGKTITVLHGHSDRVWDAAFSPDFTHLASGSRDGTVRIWNTATWECTAILKGHTLSVWSVCFSPDGNHVASGSGDCTVRVWDVATGDMLVVLEWAAYPATSVRFSYDGLSIISKDWNDNEREWKVGVDFTLPTTFSPLPPVFDLDSYSGWLFITIPSTTARRRLCWIPVEHRGHVCSSGSTVVLLSMAGVVTVLSVSAATL